MANPDLDSIILAFKLLQDNICAGLEDLDGNEHFTEDLWVRPEGGGGRSRVLQGKHIEKGGVMFSSVNGALSKEVAKEIDIAPGYFHASGVSIVLHALNPWVPIIHMNIRYFQTDRGEWWFGGGIDMTPSYIDIDESRRFHIRLKEICDRFDSKAYAKYKSWADDYFYNKHRQETRGIGGIFFDRLNEKSGYKKEKCWSFVMDVGNSFLVCYKDIFESNFNKEYNERHELWRNIRRSRYVEFNLVYDRGTRFGLKTNGRIESILMSMPPVAQWLYNYQPEEGSEEALTQCRLVKDWDWITGKAG